MKVGLFFGSFNPIHVGHMIIANHIAEFSDLDEVWFVVTPLSPFKKRSNLLPNYHRLALANIAVEDFPNLKASDIEFGLPQPNYTVNTLAYIGEKYPEHQFCLIMGEDNLKSFHKWKNYETILENYQMYVYPRISDNLSSSNQLEHWRINRIEAPVIQISSTLIRKGIKEGKDVRPMLPKDVCHFFVVLFFYMS